MAAVKTCRASLVAGDSENETNRSLSEAMLLRASNDFMELAERFAANDYRVTEHFHLHALVSTEYWANLADETASPGDRQRELVSLYSRLMFASSHLPRLLSLIASTGHAADQNAASFVLELSDLQVNGQDTETQVESAGDPDRIARVIDAANMVYRGAALLAGGSLASLELASITGRETRTLVFHGQRETATAVRRIIRHLDGIATENPIEADSSGEVTSVESLVEQLPFLTSLNELERIGALSGARIGDIRSSVIAGSIMLLEAGAVLHAADPEGLAADEIQSLSSTETRSSIVDTEVEAHYLDHFEAVREQMLGEISEPEQAGAVIDERSQKAPTLAHNDDPSDDLDDLIVDLNRLYKR